MQIGGIEQKGQEELELQKPAIARLCQGLFIFVGN